MISCLSLRSIRRTSSLTLCSTSWISYAKNPENCLSGRVTEHNPFYPLQHPSKLLLHFSYHHILSPAKFCLDLVVSKLTHGPFSKKKFSGHCLNTYSLLYPKYVIRQIIRTIIDMHLDLIQQSTCSQKGI